LNRVLTLGPLFASGRDADIFAYGPALVVRRSRRGHSMEREARVMQYVAKDGPCRMRQCPRSGLMSTSGVCPGYPLLGPDSPFTCRRRRPVMPDAINLRHALDPLTADEIRRAAAAVRAAHDLGAGMTFETVLLTCVCGRSSVRQEQAWALLLSN